MACCFVTVFAIIRSRCGAAGTAVRFAKRLGAFTAGSGWGWRWFGWRLSTQAMFFGSERFQLRRRIRSASWNINCQLPWHRFRARGVAIFNDFRQIGKWHIRTFHRRFSDVRPSIFGVKFRKVCNIVLERSRIVICTASTGVSL